MSNLLCDVYFLSYAHEARRPAWAGRDHQTGARRRWIGWIDPRSISPHRQIGTAIGAKPRRIGVWSRWRYRYDDRVADNREQAPRVIPPGARKLGLRHPR